MATGKPAAPSSREDSLRFYTEALGMKPLDLTLPYYARLRAPNGSGTIALHELAPDAGPVSLYWSAGLRTKKAGTRP
jgi:catechol 2,3-dioxygenase-like lactoylglutathione lyase family enzyme